MVNIRYTISEEEWSKAAAMRYNVDIFPTYYCFFGEVSFTIKDQEVLGSNTFFMSIADLAVGLADVLGNIERDSVGMFKFHQSDDMLEISFKVDVDSVIVCHNLRLDTMWACSRIELLKAIREFIIAFTDEAAKRVPDLFEWRELEVLRGFSMLSPKA